MKKSVFLLFVLFLSMLILSSCDLLDELLTDGDSATEDVRDLEDNSDDESTIIGSVSDLTDTDHFRNGALEHILEGELNRRGQAVGFHYEGLETAMGEVIAGTENTPNGHGVYEAKVKVSNIEKTSNNGVSTFFPIDWNAQQVVDAINEAYSTMSHINGNTYEGLSADGLQIRMYIDRSNKIISAFPIY